MTSCVRKPGKEASPRSKVDTCHLNKTERERRWLLKNAEAIRLENEGMEGDGLPLARFRLF